MLLFIGTQCIMVVGSGALGLETIVKG